MSKTMSGPRLFIALLGVVIALAGVVTAVYYDRFVGIAFVLVGGFLITLPLTRSTD